MTYRLFTKLLYVLLSTFIALNALIWFTWTKEITDPKRKTGDLLRIGYIKGFDYSIPKATTLSKHHIEAIDYTQTPVDIITVGDSFSLANKLGIGSYQDFITSTSGLTVLNIPTQKELSFQPVTMLVKLINSGYLDLVKPTYVILQTIEREAVNRLAYGFDLSDNAPVQELNNEFHKRSVSPLDIDRNLRFINNGNWNFVANSIQYRFCDKAFNSKTIKSHLVKPFFSSAHGDILYFHRDDLAAARKATPQAMATVNNNLNRLADILAAKKIKLIFMPAPDKLTLYGPYIINNPFPKSIFFDALRQQPKRYILIDSQNILSHKLAAGTQDLYYQGDTHWTWKACEAIATRFDTRHNHL